MARPSPINKCDIARSFQLKKIEHSLFELSLMTQKEQGFKIFLLIVLKVIILSLIWYMASDMFVFFI